MSFMLLLFSVCSLLGTLVEVLGKKMEGVGGIQKTYDLCEISKTGRLDRTTQGDGDRMVGRKVKKEEGPHSS